MSVYTSGAEAYRDTTKWLTAFLPVATLISGGLLVAPGLLRTLQSAESAMEWLVSNWILLLCVVVVALAVAAIIWRGAAVLAVEPTDIGALASAGAGKTALTEAIGNGAAAPYFFDVTAFDAAMSKLADSWDNNTIKSDDPLLARVPPAVEALREWSVLRQVKTPYTIFGVTFVVGSVLIAAAIVVSAALTSSAAAITSPTSVLVTISDDAQAGFTRATGCTSPTSSRFTAVGGSWDRPRLEVDGDGCRFAARWSPERTEIELRLPDKK